MIRKMKRLGFFVIGALLLVLTGFAIQSEAEVNVDVGINIPLFRFSDPPEVVVIPGTYVYMVPDIDVDILFFQGYWWRPYEGRWYRSRNYEGGWRYVSPGRMPLGLRQLPHDYRHRLSPGHERIPHGQIQKNWKRWEKDKYWEKRGEKDRKGYGEQGHGKQGDQDGKKRGKQKDKEKGKH